MTGKKGRTASTDASNVGKKAERPSRERMQAIGRIGGYARAAALTAEQQSEAGRATVRARWDRSNERRAAQGLPPHGTTPKPLTDDEMTYWLAAVDERYPDRVFENRMQRRRLAIRLARQEAARVAAEAFGRTKRSEA